MRFEIFRDPTGRWCARRQDGLVSGIFRERLDALRFARRECGQGGLVVQRGWGVALGE